jgi:hypothetical protein
MVALAWVKGGGAHGHAPLPFREHEGGVILQEVAANGLATGLMTPSKFCACGWYA